MKTISNARFLDFNEFMYKLLEYEDIVTKWKEQYPDYEAEVNILIGKEEFIIQIITCKKE